MRTGKLRHSIIIERAIESQDSTGGITTVWKEVAKVRASFEPLTGKETYTAKQEFAQATARFRIHYIAGITPKMRVVMGGRVFDITYPFDPYDRGRELHIMVVENV